MPDFEEMTEGTKKLFKNKKFLIAAAGVAGVALVVGLKKNGSTAAEDTGSMAVGYQGYPETVGQSSDNSDYYESLMEQMGNYYDTQLGLMQDQMGSMQDHSDQMYESLLDRLDALSEKEDSSNVGSNLNWGGWVTETPKVDSAAIISQMKANSTLYNAITDDATHQALHEANVALGAQIGADYEKNSGTWYLNGTQLYSVENTASNPGPVKNTVSIPKSTTTPGSASQMVANTDYQAQINKAIISGASAATIDSLNAQRTAKIAASDTNLQQANKGFDASTDYAALINKATAAGASKAVIDNLTQQRNAKIAATK